MSLRDIMVHLDGSEQTRGRVALAVELAQDHDAHLTGAYVLEPLSIPLYAEAELPASVVQAHVEAAEQGAREAQEYFAKQVRGSPVRAEWRCLRGEAARMLILNARHTDLVILGQSKTPALLDRHVADHVALGCGRPVLVVPYIGAGSTLGERVFIAWNGRREAVRAIHDALPLLERAKHVTVMAINPRAGAEEHGDVPCADICLHLARHGVEAEAAEVESGDVGVGDMLLSRAADASADLIVMGAYGHSRIRELMLGGVTKHLLEHMTVPVLMSH